MVFSGLVVVLLESMVLVLMIWVLCAIMLLPECWLSSYTRRCQANCIHTGRQRARLLCFSQQHKPIVQTSTVLGRLPPLLSLWTGGYDQQRMRSPPAITIATGFAATASHECANTGPSLTTVTDLHVTQSCSDFELHCLQCQATLPFAL